MPRGIAIDWVAGNVYWTDSGRDVIEVAQMKGENRKTLISGMIDEPHAIVVDPLRGWAGVLGGGVWARAVNLLGLGAGAQHLPLASSISIFQHVLPLSDQPEIRVLQRPPGLPSRTQRWPSLTLPGVPRACSGGA